MLLKCGDVVLLVLSKPDNCCLSKVEYIDLYSVLRSDGTHGSTIIVVFNIYLSRSSFFLE